MSIYTEMNPQIMRDMLDATMMSNVVVQTPTTTRDEFGQEQHAYASVFACEAGFRRIRISEQPSFTGTAKHFDGILRLPISALPYVFENCRFMLTENILDGRIYYYQIVGDFQTTRYHVICEVARVQE